MDDKPAIEYPPFGGITFNFDDAPIRLRRCRLGDLEFAKNLLQEKRDERGEERRLAVEEIATLRRTFTDLPLNVELSDEQREELRAKLARMNELAALLDVERVEIIYGWLAPVIQRMGDGPPPVKEDWPLEIFDPNTPNNIIDHWQTRPLASGRPSPNGTTSEAASLPPSQPVASSLQAPPPQ